MADLKEGKLPAIQIDNTTIFKLGGMLLVVVIASALMQGIVKHS